VTQVHRKWDDVSEEELRAWGNVAVTLGQDLWRDGARAHFFAMQWSIDQSGAITFRRRVLVELEGEDKSVALMYEHSTFLPGAGLVTADEFTYDPDELAEQLANSRRAQAGAALGVPNRAGRRHN